MGNSGVTGVGLSGIRRWRGQSGSQVARDPFRVHTVRVQETEQQHGQAKQTSQNRRRAELLHARA
jgi:hypothetical protein